MRTGGKVDCTLGTRKWARPLLLSFLVVLVGSVLLPAVAEEQVESQLVIVQYPDSNYEPGPGWPEGWTPPPAPTAIPPGWQHDIDEYVERYPGTQVKLTVLDPLPKWTQEYAYEWEPEIVYCATTLYFMYYPAPDSNTIMDQTGRLYTGAKYSSIDCEFRPLLAITEAKGPSEETKERDRKIDRIGDELHYALNGLTDCVGHRMAGALDRILVCVNDGWASRDWDQPAYLDTEISRVRVPVRFVSEIMGGKVDWEEETQTVTITFPEQVRQVWKPVMFPGYSPVDMFDPNMYFPNVERFSVEKQQVTMPARSIVLRVGKTEAWVDGKAVTFDAPPVLLSGRVMVPLRFVSEQLGAKVYWVGSEPIFVDSLTGEGLPGVYQVHIYTPFHPLYDYPNWFLENRGVKT